jgi:hypothetical protein
MMSKEAIIRAAVVISRDIALMHAIEICKAIAGRDGSAVECLKAIEDTLEQLR